MKRLMLISLLSCLVVGQVSCGWKENVTAFAKGAGFTAIGVSSGALLRASLSKGVLQASSLYVVLSGLSVASAYGMYQGFGGTKDLVITAPALVDSAPDTAPAPKTLAEKVSFGVGCVAGLAGLVCAYKYIEQKVQ